MILKLIWRNLWRNSRRTFITMSSIAFAVLFAIIMQSLQKGVFSNLIENVVGYYSGYIQIHKKGYWDEQILDNCYNINDTLTAAIISSPKIKEFVPRLETFVLVSKETTTKGCMLVGTDALKENYMTLLKNKLIKGEYFENSDNAVLIADGLAKILGVTINDTIVLFGQGYHGAMAAGKYPIKGIVHLAIPTLNDALIYLPLPATQYFLSAESMVTSISLVIDDTENIEMIAEELKQKIPPYYEVMTWEELMPDISNHIKTDKISFYIFSGILYLIIGFGFFGTILMMTEERKYEFGMLIAIGMKKSKLQWTLLGETCALSVLGSLLGMMISLPVVSYFTNNPIQFKGDFAKAYEQFGFEPIFPAIVELRIFYMQALVVLSIAILVGLYPLWNIFKLNAVKAMKK